MQNYWNYFTEIEQRFQQRRGSILLLSTLDWALIESWREAGVPLGAVLRGIDQAFDHHEAKKARAGSRSRRINGLAWAAQAVLQAAEQAVDAATGLPQAAPAQPDSGFEQEAIARFLDGNAAQVERFSTEAALAARLHALAAEQRSGTGPGPEPLDQILHALEESLLARLVAAAPEAELVALREQSARELGPYRARMKVEQIRQVERQFLHKRLLEARGLPRLSLFYMPHAG